MERNKRRGHCKEGALSQPSWRDRGTLIKWGGRGRNFAATVLSWWCTYLVRTHRNDADTKKQSCIICIKPLPRYTMSNASSTCLSENTDWSYLQLRTTTTQPPSSVRTVTASCILRMCLWYSVLCVCCIQSKRKACNWLGFHSESLVKKESFS